MSTVHTHLCCRHFLLLTSRQMPWWGAAIVDHLCVQRGFHDIQSWHSSRKGRVPIHGLSSYGTDHEGNSSRPGKIWWMCGIKGILDFQRIWEFEVPFKKLPCIIMYDLHSSWHHTAWVQMPCVPGCFFPRSCWARGLANGFVGPALHPLWIFDGHEHVARNQGGKGNLNTTHDRNRGRTRQNTAETHFWKEAQGRGVYKQRPKAKKVLLQDQLHVGTKFQIEKPREGSA